MITRPGGARGSLRSRLHDVDVNGVDVGTAGETGRPWRGRSPGERRAERYRRLVDAGLELFGTQGYASTSLTSVFALAAVSPRHFYELFSDREQLLAAVYGEIVEETARRLQAGLDATELEVRARVEGGLGAVLDYVTEDPRRARITQLEIVGVTHALEWQRREAIRAFAAVIDEQYQTLARASQVTAEPFGLIAIGLVGAVNEVLADWLLRDPRPPAADLLPPLTRLFAAAFTPVDRRPSGQP